MAAAGGAGADGGRAAGAAAPGARGGACGAAAAPAGAAWAGGGAVGPVGAGAGAAGAAAAAAAAAGGGPGCTGATGPAAGGPAGGSGPAAGAPRPGAGAGKGACGGSAGGGEGKAAGGEQLWWPCAERVKHAQQSQRGGDWAAPFFLGVPSKAEMRTGGPAGCTGGGAPGLGCSECSLMKPTASLAMTPNGSSSSEAYGFAAAPLPGAWAWSVFWAASCASPVGNLDEPAPAELAWGARRSVAFHVRRWACSRIQESASALRSCVGPPHLSGATSRVSVVTARCDVPATCEERADWVMSCHAFECRFMATAKLCPVCHETAKSCSACLMNPISL